ncbi:hypothetical protein [Variovorax sp. dw_308]|uniref:hypothetical protein n=1 Tax=Variovorax sp. dw_308 TaxID=2721546 RepID=UPI001C463EC5|nr:hypothetical protein [Variovorax sp. dw_308]
MAHIRTIKPEFFTSVDVVGLSPLARLLYIATWLEADREGRLLWKPSTFKLRYFPADNCDIAGLCAELLDAELVVVYGAGYAVVPSFNTHQRVNPREGASRLPAPPSDMTREARVGTGDAGEIDAQGGREGKEKEGDISRSALNDPPSGFAAFWASWPKSVRKQAQGKCLQVWKKAGAESVAAEILDHLEALKQSLDWTKNDGQFIPAPLSYLNGRRWEGAEVNVVQESFV